MSMTTQLHDAKGTTFYIDSLCSKIVDDIGYYRAQDLASHFSLPALGSWRARRQIFVLTFEGKAAYPAFQFTLEGIDPAVAEVNAALPLAMSSTQRLLWWAMPNEHLETRLGSLQKDLAPILAAAQDLSTQWDLADAVDAVFAPRQK